MERVGMRREAQFVHDNYVKGEWIDDFVYAMLDEEWHRHHVAMSALISAQSASI